MPKVEIQTPEGWKTYGEYRNEDEAARVAETLTKRGFSARVSKASNSIWEKGSVMWQVERFQRIKSAVANLAERSGKRLVGFEPWSIPETYEPDFPFEPLNIDLGEAVVTGRYVSGDVTVLEVREKLPHATIDYAFLRPMS